MAENQKNQTVQRNLVGKKRSFPIIQDDNDNESDSFSGTEEEQESPIEIKEQEDSKYPHKQGTPTGSQEKSERSF